MKDIIVEEIRNIRHNIELEYGNNPDLYLEHIYEAQQKHGEKLVCRKPRKLNRKGIA